MMMKFALCALLAASVAASSEMHQMVDIKADSAVGQKLLSEARLLSQTLDTTWVSGYSLKFQGCHHISQWNDEANGADDVRIATKRLVRFRLCPSDSCNLNKASGCSEGYGDYILDMSVYLTYYFEAIQTYKEYECSYLKNYVCGESCKNGNYQNGGSENMCMWDCYAEHGVADTCMGNNPYYQNGEYNQNQGQQFAVEKYLACAAMNNGAAYIGPYCSQQGGSIHLGVFSDDTCTTFSDNTAGRETYFTAMGTEIPYGTSNLIAKDCFSCKEPSENNNMGDDASDSDSTNEMCEVLYNKAGKCEEHLPFGTTYEQNNNACNYLEGIKIVRKDGTVMIATARANKTASIFIGIFAVAFVLLSAYVYYLKTKLDRASINLSE
jgi:hypothetical protein